MLKRGALRPRAVSRKDCGRTHRTLATRRRDKDSVAYGARPSDGNKRGEGPALKEKSRRSTACCLQALLAAALRRSNVAGALSAVGGVAMAAAARRANKGVGDNARSSDNDVGSKRSVRQGDGQRCNTLRFP